MCLPLPSVFTPSFWFYLSLVGLPSLEVLPLPSGFTPPLLFYASLVYLPVPCGFALALFFYQSLVVLPFPQGFTVPRMGNSEGVHLLEVLLFPTGLPPPF